MAVSCKIYKQQKIKKLHLHSKQFLLRQIIGSGAESAVSAFSSPL